MDRQEKYIVENKLIARRVLIVKTPSERFNGWLSGIVIE